MNKPDYMNDRTDPSKEWNQNILRNLRFKFPDLAQVDDRILLIRYNEWSAGFCFGDDAEGMEDYLKIGE